jgi:hypothetical protein
VAIYRRVVVEDVTVDHIPTQDEADAAGGFVDWLDQNGTIDRVGVESGSWVAYTSVSDTNVYHDVSDADTIQYEAHMDDDPDLDVARDTPEDIEASWLDQYPHDEHVGLDRPGSYSEDA